MLVLVTGATGFLGRRVVLELLRRHHEVRCLVHVPGRERIFDHRTVEVHYGNILNPESLSSAFTDVDAVVHLVAIIRPTRRLTFDLVNRWGTANVVAAAKKAKVKEFHHVSVIGAANDPSYPYHYSKWLGEQLVINSGLPFTVIRPSVIFGQGDEFTRSLAGLIRLFPVVPVIGSGKTRFQPIAVEDLAMCIAMAVEKQDVKGGVWDLGGPDRLNYNEIVDEVAIAMGKSRVKFPMPTLPVFVGVKLLQNIMQRSPVTTDQIRMLGLRNVAEIGEVERCFGFTPRPLRGNIDFVNSVGLLDSLQMVLGLMSGGRLKASE